MKNSETHICFKILHNYVPQKTSYVSILSKTIILNDDILWFCRKFPYKNEVVRVMHFTQAQSII